MAFNIVTIYFFQSINKARKSMMISMSSGIIFIIIGFIILIPKLNTLGAWMVYPFAEISGFIVSLIIIYTNKLKTTKELSI